MCTVMQTFQSVLPLALFERLGHLRSRYAHALQRAASGDYSRARELGTVARRLGRLLATEARKSPDERGGLRMLDISLAVDQLFPELRGWNQHETALLQRRRLRESYESRLGLPVAVRGSQAS